MDTTARNDELYLEGDVEADPVLLVETLVGLGKEALEAASQLFHWSSANKNALIEKKAIPGLRFEATSTDFFVRLPTNLLSSDMIFTSLKGQSYYLNKGSNDSNLKSSSPRIIPVDVY